MITLLGAAALGINDCLACPRSAPAMLRPDVLARLRFWPPPCPENAFYPEGRAGIRVLTVCFR